MSCIAIVCLIAIGTSALAESPAEEARTTVNVYVLENVNDPGLNLGWAKSVTSHIFAESGVRIKWRLGQLRRGQPDMPIIIDLRANAPKTLAPGALAFAQVYEGVHICVFGDRVKETVRGANPLATFVLAHVMAHEITHVSGRDGPSFQGRTHEAKLDEERNPADEYQATPASTGGCAINSSWSAQTLAALDAIDYS